MSCDPYYLPGILSGGLTPSLSGEGLRSGLTAVATASLLTPLLYIAGACHVDGDIRAAQRDSEVV